MLRIRSKGQRSRSHGYKKKSRGHTLPVKCAAAGVGLHVGRTARVSIHCKKYLYIHAYFMASFLYVGVTGSVYVCICKKSTE